MKVLYILRHGKSSWADKNLADAARDLTPRGEKAAQRMGAECASRGWQPALALVSTALRARRTCDIFAQALRDAGAAMPEVRFADTLYLATPAQIARVLAEHGGAAPSVLIVGHNPGLHELSLILAAGGTDTARDDLHAGFPTCTLVRAEIDTENWAALPGAPARVDAVLKPKKLDQS